MTCSAVGCGYRVYFFDAIHEMHTSWVHVRRSISFLNCLKSEALLEWFSYCSNDQAHRNTLRRSCWAHNRWGSNITVARAGESQAEWNRGRVQYVEEVRQSRMAAAAK